MLDDVVKFRKLNEQNALLRDLRCFAVQTICESLYIHTFTSRESAYLRDLQRRVVVFTVCPYVDYISRRKRQREEGDLRLSLRLQE